MNTAHGPELFDRSAPRYADGSPFYCACGCGGPYHECEQPTSELESVEAAHRRHAHWRLKEEFGK